MRFDFRLTGEMPLLMHADIVEQCDTLMAWRKSPENKKLSVPGDDRSPAWTWQTYLYSDGEHISIPSDNIMTALRTAGAKMSLKGKETFKKLSQSGLVILTEHCDLTIDGKQIPLAAIEKIREKTFADQAKLVKPLGFTLFVKRAKVGEAKHVRVRARFEEWVVSGQIETLENAITAEVLQQMFEIAGVQVGLGDWRPSAPKSPGPFGRFAVKLSASK